jgi:murein L,D-transpeptidase YcbB/YkuD
MIRALVLSLGVTTLLPVLQLFAAELAVVETAAPPASPAIEVPAPVPSAGALRKALANLPAGTTDEERNEYAALTAFYEARGYELLWLTPEGPLTIKGLQITAETGRAGDWGLDPHDFPLPGALDPAGTAAPEAVAAAEIKVSLAVLKYGRYARGGRIVAPSERLSSYLDRRPQLLAPKEILDGIAAAEQPDAYLRGLNPKHPQFEALRQKYLALPANTRTRSALGKKLLANMEEWRWMPADMGEVYIWNNIPEFTQRVIKNGETIRTERIVAGETGKQTPIFTRNLKKITFKPTWIVPDSIKVRELWPSLLHGGGLMRQWALEVRTKEGQPVNWRKVNWASTDIRTYDVIQPNGPKTVLGKVKFSFPSQHTVFMHDTRREDKWMFNAAQRTYSHGCMRVRDPIGLAEIVLREDKGWDAKHVREAVSSGPLNNEILIEHKIPVHITYFTAMVDARGELHTFPDVYGHEHRIVLALEGKWDRIEKGRDHLAPVEGPSEARRTEEAAASANPRRSAGYRDSYSASFLENIFGD